MEKNILEKHAYLIIAHKCDLTFKTLISLLDDARNDIYIHMDIKNKEYEPKAIESLVQFAKIYHVKRTGVNWGGYSQIRTELILLEEATNNGYYEYYHLISGEDLPIKTQDYIHDFLKNKDCEFIGFADNSNQIDYRVKKYHYFQELLHPGKMHSIIILMNKISLKLQDIFKITRNKNIDFYKGSNWFSITDDFARYVVSKKTWIEKIFKNTHCADEIFLQTLIMNSEFKSRINPGEELKASLRLIDWKRGEPYVFVKEDYNELISSDRLFARKFVASKDSEIIDKLKQYLTLAK